MNFYCIYLLVSQDKQRTYVGFSENLDKRIDEHAKGKVKTTKNFGEFSHRILEKVTSIELARIAEKYWKSSSGRRKIKEILK